MKRIFRYLKGTHDFSILYTHSPHPLFAFSDVDWAGNLDDHRSTTGYVFVLSNAPVSWRSVGQSCVALLSAEAEYVALAATAQEAVWQRKLLTFLLDYKDGGAVEIQTDSQSTMAMCKKSSNHGRTKHIDIKKSIIFVVK